MPSVPLDLQPWQSFYTTLAAVAATLAGLLFVALSFNLELLARAEHEPTNRIATEAFTMFLYVLLVALLVLMPHETRLGLVVKLAAIGVVGLGGAIAFAVQTWRGAPGSVLHQQALRRFAWSGVVFLALLVTAMGVLRHWPWVLHWAGIALIVLLFAAVRRAWYLLVTVRRLELRREHHGSAVGYPRTSR
jgi:modulator of FtsH protease